MDALICRVSYRPFAMLPAVLPPLWTSLSLFLPSPAKVAIPSFL